MKARLIGVDQPGLMGIVSYLASRFSRDVVSAGRQQLTHSWWEMRRPAFDLVISEVVPLHAG